MLYRVLLPYTFLTYNKYNLYINGHGQHVRDNGFRIAGSNTNIAEIDKEQKDNALYALTQNSGDEAILADEAQELGQNYVYGLLDNGYATNHAGLLAFYDSQKDSTIEVFNTVDSLIASGNYIGAQNLNATAAANSQIQQNQQVLNAALLKYTQNNAAVFTEAELQELNTLAHKCPLVDGESVYQVRGLLCSIYNEALEFTDNCEFASAARKKAPSANGAAESSWLFPNPNNGSMTLHYQLNSNATLHIYDVSGRELNKLVLDKNNNTVTINLALAQGVYFYSIIKDNATVLKTDKLIILK